MRKLFILSLLAMMIAWGIGGCGGGSGGTSADPLGTDGMMFGHKNDASGTDWSTAMAVTTRGTVILTAKLKNASDHPVIGREVTFVFVSNASGATLSSTKANTDSTGEAMTIYTAGMVAGFDVVRASISNGATLDTNITVASVAGGLQIALDGSPASLSAGQVSILTATVTDSSGNVVSGQTVGFSFISNQSGAPALTVLNLGLTDASGRAVAVYTAGATTPNTEVQDTVKAEIVGVAATALILTRTSNTALPPVGYRMALTADVTSLAAGQSAIITATVTDGLDNPASGQTVTFALLSNISGATLATLNGGNTDSSGRAVAVYTAGATSPTTTVQDAVQASVVGSTMAIVMTRTAAGGGGVTGGVRMTVTATPTSLIAGAMSVIVAQVNNADGTAAAGLAVTFGFVTNNSGAPALTPVNTTTDASGTAIVTYTAGNNSPGLSIQDVVSASVTGSAGAAIITRLPATGTGGVTMTVTPNSSSLSAGSQSIVEAKVLNADGTPATGQIVTFATSPSNSGAANPTPGSSPTNAEGKAFATYTAGNNFPGSIVFDVVTASVTGAAGSSIIERTAAAIGTGNQLAFTADPTTLPATGGNSIFTATVTAENGSPVTNEPVTFSILTGPGTITGGTPLTVNTDTNGKAWVIFTGAASPGDTVIQAAITERSKALIISW